MCQGNWVGMERYLLYWYPWPGKPADSASTIFTTGHTTGRPCHAVIDTNDKDISIVLGAG